MNLVLILWTESALEMIVVLVLVLKLAAATIV